MRVFWRLRSRSASGTYLGPSHAQNRIKIQVLSCHVGNSINRPDQAVVLARWYEPEMSFWEELLANYGDRLATYCRSDQPLRR